MDFSSFFMALLFIFGVVAVLLAFLGYKYRHMQYDMLYQRGTADESSATCDAPSLYGISPSEPLHIVTADGVTIRGYLIRPQGEPTCTLVYFHGNAGNVGHRLPIAKMLLRSLRCVVVMVDYRGYGLSDPVAPTERGLQLDADATLEYVLSSAAVDRERVFVMGVSLGGAVAVHLASRAAYQRHIAGLVLENTFTSISDMVDALFTPLVHRLLPNAGPYVLPFLKYFVKPLVLAIGWWSIDKIRRLPMPILFLSSTKDEIVPCEQMRRLYAAATGSRMKRFCDFPHGHHNDLCTKESYCDKIMAFVKDVLAHPTTEP
jgi:pimeloyl-ACP methyl ester carboxylesterase